MGCGASNATVQEKQSSKSAPSSEQDVTAMDIVPEESVPSYTVLDIQAHNRDNPRDWFKYGRKIYSNYKFWPAAKKSAQNYDREVYESTRAINPKSVWQPVSTAQQCGIPYEMVCQLLPYCLVGICVDIPLEEYLKSTKKDVEGILNDLNDEDDMPESKYILAYKKQLSRWLSCYPNIQRDNKLNDYSTDPNKMAFPLPSEIQNAPTALQQLFETFEPFDTEVPSGGAWDTSDKDLVKNDVTTSEQDAIWKLREKRTNLGDTKWMATRRQAIGDSLTARYEWEPHIVVPYLKCCDNLDESWRKFQELCDK